MGKLSERLNLIKRNKKVKYSKFSLDKVEYKKEYIGMDSVHLFSVYNLFCWLIRRLPNYSFVETISEIESILNTYNENDLKQVFLLSFTSTEVQSDYIDNIFKYVTFNDEKIEWRELDGVYIVDICTQVLVNYHMYLRTKDFFLLKQKNIII